MNTPNNTKLILLTSPHPSTPSRQADKQKTQQDKKQQGGKKTEVAGTPEIKDDTNATPPPQIVGDSNVTPPRPKGQACWPNIV
jgi:hypothetical protein